MLERTKTFIIGAGASAEFGLPTGRQLVERIQEFSDIEIDPFERSARGDRLLRASFSAMPRDDGKRWNPSGLASVALKVRANMGLAPSIDYFLDSKADLEGWPEVGKLLIARSILAEERKSQLYFNRNQKEAPSFDQLPENWLTELFKILASQPKLAGFRKALNSCNFTTFNYDRTIEQFFHQSIKSYFMLDDNSVDELCRENLNVFHVYGGLGNVTSSNSGYFGLEDDPRYLVEAARSIRTFTESVEDGHLTLPKKWIAESDCVVFLGFGFLPLNIKALFSGVSSRTQVRVIGTAFKIPAENLTIAKSILSNLWAIGTQQFEFEQSMCAELIWQHAYYLSEYS